MIAIMVINPPKINPKLRPKLQTTKKVDERLKIFSEALFAICGFLIFVPPSLSVINFKKDSSQVAGTTGLLETARPNFSLIEIETENTVTFLSHVEENSAHYLVVVEYGDFVEVFKYVPGSGVERTFSQDMNGRYFLKSAIGDFNNDGKWDLAVTEGTPETVGIWIGNGEGGLTYSNSYETADFTPDRVATGDFNEDGNLDIIMTDWLHGDIMVMLNDGEAAFSYKSRYETDGGPQELIVQDFNGDTHQDFIVATMTYNNSLQMFGDGSGEFFVPQEYELGYDGYTSSYTDLDEDGIKDYIAGTGHQILFFKGKSNGTFRKPGTPFGYGYGPIQYRSVVGDFNGDGHQDVFSFIRGKNDDDPPKIQWWWGNGAGNLTPSQKLDITGIGEAGEVWPLADHYALDNKTDIVIPGNDSTNPKIKLLIMR